MKKLTLNIRDNKYHTFLEFVKTLDYVEVAEADNKSLSELENSLKQVKKMQDGKIEKQNVQDFIDEL